MLYVIPPLTNVYGSIRRCIGALPVLYVIPPLTNVYVST
jgi:hypothetical protein